MWNYIYIYDYDEHHDECDITALQSSRASLSCVRRARSTRLGEEYYQPVLHTGYSTVPGTVALALQYTLALALLYDMILQSTEYSPYSSTTVHSVSYCIILVSSCSGKSTPGPAVVPG